MWLERGRRRGVLAVGGLVIMARAGGFVAAAATATLIDGGHGGALSPGLLARRWISVLFGVA